MFRLFLLSIVCVGVLIAVIDGGTDKGHCYKTDQYYEVDVDGQRFIRHMWQCQDGSTFYRYDRGDIYNIREQIENSMNQQN